MHDPRRPPRRATVLALVLLASLGWTACRPGSEPTGPCYAGDPPSIVTPITEPGAPGTWPVGHRIVTVTDASRSGRVLPTDVWYPITLDQAQGERSRYYAASLLGIVLGGDRASVEGSAFEFKPAAPGKFGLVVVSHGDGGMSTDYIYLCEALASHGFVVVAPNHTGNTLADAAFGGAVSQEQTLADRPLDVSSVITVFTGTSAPADFCGRVDAGRIAVVGHSYGGFTAIASVAQADGSVGDPRIRATVPIDPFTGRLTVAQTAALRNVPVLYFTGTRSDLRNDVLGTFMASRGAPLLLGDLANAAHQNFSSLCALAAALRAAGTSEGTLSTYLGPAYTQSCAPPAIAYADAFRLTSLLTTAFLRRWLNGETFYDTYLVASWFAANESQIALTQGNP